MKRPLLTILFVLVCTAITYAQQWLIDFVAAKQIAAKDDKPIILVFQGSDWCAPCMKLDKEIWSSETFKNYAKDHYVMLKADFPRKKANKLPEEIETNNKKLAEKYNTGGYFPYVVVLDKNGKILGTTGYKKTTPDEYIELLDSFIL